MAIYIVNLSAVEMQVAALADVQNLRPGPKLRLPYRSGWRQRRPLKRLKSRSVVIHSHPDSIAIAAR